MNKTLLEMLVCPACKGLLQYQSKSYPKELWCRAEKIAFPVIDDIPVMLLDKSRPLSLAELDAELDNAK